MSDILQCIKYLKVRLHKSQGTDNLAIGLGGIIIFHRYGKIYKVLMFIYYAQCSELI